MARTWSLGALESVPNCPACGSGARTTQPWKIKDHLGTGAPDVWQLWRCADCASIFLDPRPDAASIPATYRSYYTHVLPRSPKDAGALEQKLWLVFRGYLGKRFGWREGPAFPWGFALCAAIPPLKFKLDYLARHLFAVDFPQKGVLLDHGCGNGEFLASATKMGWSIIGVDADLNAIAACKAQGFESVFGSIAELPPELEGRVDVVTSSNCVEHLQDPHGFLLNAHRLLKPNGRLWIATPNPEGLGVRIFGRFWRGLEPSRHLCVPSQRQLKCMLKSAGYDNIRLLPRGSHGKTIARESAAVSAIESRAGDRFSVWLAWMAWPLRIFTSTFGALIPKLGEETVVIARRKSDGITEEKAT